MVVVVSNSNSSFWPLVPAAAMAICVVTATIYTFFSQPQTQQEPTATIEPAAATIETVLEEATATHTPEPTATPTPADVPPSIEYNPFSQPWTDPADSFSIFEAEPVENFYGTIVESYPGQLYINYLDTMMYAKPFTWLVVRDREDDSLEYLMYPAERVFPGGEVIIDRYWPIKKNVALTNHILAYIISINPENLYYYDETVFRIESPAPDGHTDGIIELGGIEYVTPEGE